MQKRSMRTIDEMFYSKSTEDEEQFRSRTIGLVSMETYKKHMNDVRRGIKPENNPRKTKIIQEIKPKKMKYNPLSFEFDQVNDAPDQIPDEKNHSDYTLIESASKAKTESLLEENKSTKFREKCLELDFNTIGKDTSIDTSFLPDKKRELEELNAKEKLRLEEFEREEKLKQEIIEVVFSYWDGSGHRRSVHVQRNTTIGEFLEKCRIKLKSEFKEFSRLSR
ncbi:XAP5 domain-containing [Cryptosporidium sp. chipmunk genotype I]|uniref:XAP5 domain-containing n=1 Tax=Cryptosporidium sp. chipmunk genotype I TaxID=1280935 RepID=UPI00351AACC4|nr:XAP5 domain-containing [Cryptosporidium sp. chipmunk genotype I]